MIYSNTSSLGESVDRLHFGWLWIECFSFTVWVPMIDQSPATLTSTPDGNTTDGKLGE